WKRGWWTILLDRRPSLATTWAGMSRHPMIESVGMAGSSCGDGGSDGGFEVAEPGLPALESEAETVGGGPSARGQLGIVGLSEVDDAPVVLEVHRQQLGMAVEPEAGPDD